MSNRGEEGGVCIDFKPVAYQGFKEAWGVGLIFTN